MYTQGPAQVETYNYDANGHLQSVAVAVQDLPYYDVWGTNNPQPRALGPAVTRAVYSHDAMGRTLAQSDYLDDGTTVAYSRSVAYNAKGQVTSETTNTRQGTDTWTSVIASDYGSGAAYALGAAVTVSTTDSKNGYYQYATTTTNSFDWWDGAVQSQVDHGRAWRWPRSPAESAVASAMCSARRGSPAARSAAPISATTLLLISDGYRM